MAVVGEAVIEEEDSEAGLHMDTAHIEATVEGIFPSASHFSLLTHLSEDGEGDTKRLASFLCKIRRLKITFYSYIVMILLKFMHGTLGIDLDPE